MKKCIGLICEGPTDRIVLRTIISHISQEENDNRKIVEKKGRASALSFLYGCEKKM